MNGFPNYGSYFNPFVEEKEEPKDKEKHMDGKMITTDVVK